MDLSKHSKLKLMIFQSHGRGHRFQLAQALSRIEDQLTALLSAIRWVDRDDAFC